MVTEQKATEAIRKTLVVDTRPGEAFRVFADRLGEWWPREYALGGDRTERVVVEPREGGRVYELETDGTEHEWGAIAVYDSPRRLVLSWGLNGSEVEVRFAAAGEGTRVELEHRGWERLEDGQERAEYDVGWDVILSAYRGVANAAAILRKSVRVARPPADAFRLYTDGFGLWWPLRTHSVEEERAAAAIFEGGGGGRIYERAEDGTEHTWGRVLEWDPPTRFLHTWHPGRPEAPRQTVEVRFLPDGEGTLVELEHRGWDEPGAEADTRYTSYDKGWGFVLEECFARAAS